MPVIPNTHTEIQNMMGHSDIHADASETTAHIAQLFMNVLIAVDE